MRSCLPWRAGLPWGLPSCLSWAMLTPTLALWSWLLLPVVIFLVPNSCALIIAVSVSINAVIITLLVLFIIISVY